MPLQKEKRPFYNIAHHCNTIREVYDAIENGANAIECDIKANYIEPVIIDDLEIGEEAILLQRTGVIHLEKKVEFKIYHPWDFCKARIFSQSTSLKKAPAYFQCLSQLLSEKKLTLIMFDIKKSDDVKVDPKSYAENFIDTLKKYNIDTRYCLLSVCGNDTVSIKKFYDGLGHNFLGGLSVYDGGYQNNDLDHWLQFLSDLKVSCVDLGIDSKVFTSPLSNWTPWINALVKKRDSEDPGELKKIIFWTLVRKSSMRTILNCKVDGIITNFPEKLKEVLQEPPYNSLFQLATQEDLLCQRYIAPTFEETCEIIPSLEPEQDNSNRNEQSNLKKSYSLPSLFFQNSTGAGVTAAECIRDRSNTIT